MSDILTIEKLGHQGDGMAASEKGQIFVPFTLEGERVETSGTSTRRLLSKVIEPSPNRIDPVCKHFGTCGGCQLQHFAPAPYLVWKKELVEAVLGSLNLEVEIEDVISFTNAKRRRAVFSAAHSSDGIVFGFTGRGSHDLIDIEECPVISDAITSKIEVIKKIVRPILAPKGKSAVYVSACENGLDIQVEAKNTANEKSRRSAAKLALEAGIARLSIGDETLIESKRPVLTMGTANVVPPPGAFIQAQAEAEKLMAQLVCDHLKPCKKTADLFCGIGTFALRLAQQSTVFASESDQASLDALNEAWRGTGGQLKAITCEKRDLYLRPVMSAELKKIQGVVFDPPRAGAEAQAKQLAQSKVRKVAAVSCNPTTLVRDLEILIKGGFNIKRITPIDQFSHTPHIEVVVLLER